MWMVTVYTAYGGGWRFDFGLVVKHDNIADLASADTN